jgi:hypothetical protein
VKDRLAAYGLGDRFGADRFHPTLGTAVAAFLAATGTAWVDWTDRFRSKAGCGVMRPKALCFGPKASTGDHGRSVNLDGETLE